jgi:NADH-quinone oxidoreductase subunit L
MTFHGPYRGDAEAHHSHAHDGTSAGHEHGHTVKLEDVHESPWVILAPLIVLALGALFAGMLFDSHFIGQVAPDFWRQSIAAIYGHQTAGAEELPVWVELAPFVLTIVGFAIAYYYYVLPPDVPPQLAARKGMLYTFLYNKWYFDELYAFLFVEPAKKLGRFLWKVDASYRRAGPDGMRACSMRRAARPAAIGLRLPLRLRHADGRCRSRDLVPFLHG